MKIDWAGKDETEEDDHLARGIMDAEEEVDENSLVMTGSVKATEKKEYAGNIQPPPIEF